MSIECTLGTDLKNNLAFTKKMNKKGITHIAGLISVDNDKGNSSISFVWYDESKNKFYRISNISIAKYNEAEKKWSKTRLPRSGKTEFLELKFGDNEYYNKEEEIEI